MSTKVTPNSDKAQQNTGFKRKKSVTRPVLKLVENQPVFFKVEAPLFKGEKISEKKDPATLLNVINLETGEECLIVAPKLLSEAFEKNYLDDSYVGKCFELTILALKKKDGADAGYRPIQLYEIEEQ